MEMLLKLGRNAVELGVQAGTDGVDRGDDDYGNTRSYQAIFDRGRTRFVFNKRKNARHVTHSQWLFFTAKT